jgi:hypothetical protein
VWNLLSSAIELTPDDVRIVRLDTPPRRRHH